MEVLKNKDFIVCINLSRRSQMKIYFPILFALLACFFLFIGVKAVLSKKPVFIFSKYFYGLIVLAFLPLLINTADMISKGYSGKIGLIMYLNPVLFVFLLVFFWFQMKGYMAIGISDDSFREAIHFSLNKNELPFEEKLSVMTLPSLNNELQVAIQSWIGSGQIKLKRSEKTGVLPKIIAAIDEYYATKNITANNFTSIFYIVMGTLMLFFAGVFFYVLP